VSAKNFHNNNSTLDLTLVDHDLSACYNNYIFENTINGSPTTTDGKFTIESSGFVTVLVILIILEFLTATIAKLFLAIYFALD
jgi:hypothetical protein